eukprot:TRINITY_DN22076_c0_g2_i1.p1 TRINITY_DN22076_c0_g2~~TRINITY_DN22076_c0_g2_i1.p1  ORF type:complete len:170 (-),score=23.22 TRINITY_DN22076_c0_g2_i1:47-556(-)
MSPAVIAASGWLKIVPLWAKIAVLASGYFGSKFISAASGSRERRAAAARWMAVPTMAAHLSTMVVLVQMFRSKHAPSRLFHGLAACGCLSAGLSSAHTAYNEMQSQETADPMGWFKRHWHVFLSRVGDPCFQLLQGLVHGIILLKARGTGVKPTPVSYTHLTLPTKRIV